jgi:hypothetical protein
LVLSICAVALNRLVNRIEQRLVAKGFGQKLNRAGLHRFHRHRNVAMAGNEDDRNRKTAAASSRWRSRPLNPGKRTSSTRHAGASGRLNLKNACAEAKISARIPIERNKRDSASRIETSSSTANTIGSSGFTL